MVVSCWCHVSYNDESYDPWIHCQTINIKSSHYSMLIPQAAFVECNFFVIFQVFNVSFSYFQPLTFNTCHHHPYRRIYVRCYSIESRFQPFFLHFQVREKHLHQVWIYISSQPKEPLQSLLFQLFTNF